MTMENTQWKRFMVKTVAATETEFTLSRRLRTIEDLRNKIYLVFRIPKPLQRLIGNGKVIPPHGVHGGCDITSYLPEEIDNSYTPIIWICWMTEYDYYNVTEGGFILESEADEKERRYEAESARRLALDGGQHPRRPFELITLYSYARIFERNQVLLEANEDTRRANNDDGP